MGDRAQGFSPLWIVLLVAGGSALPNVFPSVRSTSARSAPAVLRSSDVLSKADDDKPPIASIRKSVFDLIDEAVRNVEHDVPSPSQEAAQIAIDDPEQKGRWHALRSRARSSKSPRTEVSFLIATMPDPIDSHSIVDFDSELTAMQWAMGQQGLLLDRYWLPWKAWLAHKGKEELPRDY